MRHLSRCRSALALIALVLAAAPAAASRCTEEHGTQNGLEPRDLSFAESQYQLAGEALGQGKLDEAEALLEAALCIQERDAPDSLAVAGSRNRLGSVALNRGRLDLAEKFFESALAIRRKLRPESREVASSYNNLGNVALNRDELDLAWHRHQQALAIRQKLAPDSLTVAASLTNLGITALYRSELDLAQEYLERGLAIKRELAPGSATMAASLSSLGNLALRRGQPDAASELLEQALQIRQELAPDSHKVAHNLNMLGVVNLRLGELEVARDYSNRALTIYRRIAPGSLAMADVLDNLGAIALESGELEMASEHYLEAFSIGERLAPGGPAKSSILNRLGRVARRRGELDLAADYFARSLEALEGRVARLAASHDTRGDLRATYGHHYRDAIELMIDMGRAEQAFAVLERSRARSFLAMLAERDLALAADLPVELRARRRTIGERHDRIQSQIWGLDPATDGQAIEALVGQLVELRRERDDVAAEIRRASPRRAALRYPETVGVAAAREALDPGTVMLSYSVGEDRSEVFVLSPENGLEVHALAIGEKELRRQVELFREQIQIARTAGEGSGGKIFVEAASRRLYRLLIEPALQRVAGGERLLLIPDGPLHHLPFAALMGDEGYLAEWRPLHTILSATVYAQRRRGISGPVEESPFQLAAFGDPRYPRQDSGGTWTDRRLRSAVERGLALAPLPSSRREVAEIAGLYPAEAAAVYVGGEATEERVKSLGRGVRYLHFATHGFIDQRLPMSSGLALTIPEEFHEDRDNGLLQAWEIFESVRLDADLVVLSACGSSLGKEQGGDGLLSLTRAFQYAGARSVAATLWNVEDRVTAELMVRFYRHLKEGLSKDQALRSAQVELIREPIQIPGDDGELRDFDASAPYYWAAFQLTGDWQ